MTTKAEQIRERLTREAEESFIEEGFGQLDLSAFPHLQEPIKEESLEDEQFSQPATDRPMSLRNSITRFVNENSADAEIAGTLRAAGVIDEGAPHRFFLGDGTEATVYLGRDNKWRVTANLEGGQQTIKCASATNRDDAMTGASKWLNSKRGPQIRTLAQDQELYCARLAGMGKRDEAILNFLAYSVPDYEGTDISSDPKYTDVCNRCAWFVFKHSTPQFQDGPEIREFMTQYVGDRPITVELLQFAFRAYLEQTQKAERGLLLNQIENRDIESESEPTYEALDNLSDDELFRLRDETLRERAKKIRASGGGILQ